MKHLYHKFLTRAQGNRKASAKFKAMSNRTYIGHGFSAGRIIVEAENRTDAWEQISRIEWNCACSCGNHPDAGKEEDIIEVPRFVNVYAIPFTSPEYIYRKRTTTGSWEYFTTPEMAFAHATSLGMVIDKLHPLTIKQEI